MDLYAHEKTVSCLYMWNKSSVLPLNSGVNPAFIRISLLETSCFLIIKVAFSFLHPVLRTIKESWGLNRQNVYTEAAACERTFQIFSQISQFYLYKNCYRWLYTHQENYLVSAWIRVALNDSLSHNCNPQIQPPLSIPKFIYIIHKNVPSRLDISLSVK